MQNSIWRIGKPDCPVRGHDHVIWRVQLFALPGFGDGDDAPVVLCTTDTTVAMLTAEQSALKVHGLTVWMAAIVAKYTD